MWYIILALLTTIYLLTNLLLPNLIGGLLGSYIIRPILWILLAITIIIITKKEGLNIYKFKKIKRWEIGKNPLQAAILIAGFQISLLIIAGLFFGFGDSPYAFTPLAILTNLLFVISAILGIELARAYLIKKWSTTKKNITIVLGTIAILFMIIAIKPTNFLTLTSGDPLNTIKFIGETIIPILAMSLFASYIAYLGGAYAAITYMAIIQGFEWFSPFLPNLDWAITALIGTIAPAIGFVIIQNSIQIMQKTPKGKRKRRKKKDPAIGWTALATICVVFIFFSTGFFGVQPTIIYSGSMRSEIDVGDIVLISEVPLDEIHVGDIIQYQNENMSIPVVHRVHEIYDDGENIVFITKGDSNDRPDREPVMPGHVMGKVVFNLPKIGWIPIMFKEMFYKIGLKF